jgi:hypothetical protein
VPSFIVEKPDYARLIGTITAGWSVAEMLLSLVFSFLLGTDHTRAHAVYFTLQGHRARFEVVKADRLAEFRELLSRLSTVTKERNTFAHNLWGVSPTGAVNLINMGNPNKDRMYIGLDDLQAVADDISGICEDLHRFSLRLWKREDLLDPAHSG